MNNGSIELMEYEILERIKADRAVREGLYNRVEATINRVLVSSHKPEVTSSILVGATMR